METFDNNPKAIELSREQREELAAAANDAKKPWPNVFAEALEQYRNRDSGLHKKTTAFGAGRGAIKLAHDFDAPLEDFREY